MLKNKNIKIGENEYIVNGLDAISAIALLPLFQEVTTIFSGMGSGVVTALSPTEIKEKLNTLLLGSGVLREVYDMSSNGNPLARDLSHHSQLPTAINQIGELIQAIGEHVYAYDIQDTGESKKK